MKPLPFALPDVGEEEIEAVSKCIASGWLTSGPVVKSFESEFSDFLGVKHAIAVNSATSGALLIFDALGIGPGDEVIVPTYTFSGPAMMAHRLGARVVLADCLPDSFQIDPRHVENLITPRTRVIMPTHFAGQACDMYSLAALCSSRNIVLIDDAAHAFPTHDHSTGTLVGSGKISRATFFSFYATKTLTTGEGGMVTTNDDALADEIRRYRSHGFNRSIFDRYTNIKTGWHYDIDTPGWKANMPDTAAAMGLIQLHRAKDLKQKRRRIAFDYMGALVDNPNITLPDDDAGDAWHLFPILVPKRDAFIEQMGLKGIQCSVHFTPLHLFSHWQSTLGVEPGMFPCAETLFEGEVSLPLFSKMSKDDVSRVTQAVLETLGVLV